MKLKDQEVGLMIVTIMKGLDKLDELDGQIKTIYFRMLSLLVNHFIYSIKDLKRVEDFTDEEKFFIELPLLGVFLDPDSLSEEDPFKKAIIKARVMSMEQELQEIKDKDIPLN
jgi:hypothetical protein